MAWGAVSGSVAPSAVAVGYPTSHAAPNLVAVDLLHQTSISNSLVLNGFMNTNNRSFPVLLSGTSTSQFWPLSQSVLGVAPHLPGSTQGHDAGTLWFPQVGSVTMTLRAIGAFDGPGVSAGGGALGDGFEAYFLVTPPKVGNWSTPYYATDPEGANGTFLSPQGSVMFPYSTTPYIVVQWDPAHALVHPFNVYIVDPGPGGVVGQANIRGIGQLGEHPFGPGGEASPYVFIHLNFTYNVKPNTLTVDVNAPSKFRSGGGYIADHLWINLSPLGFVRPAGDLGQKSFYFGLGASGNYPTGWGLLYLSLFEPTAPP